MDKGNADLIMFESWDDNKPEGNLVCLGEYQLVRVLFIKFDFINYNTLKPVEVDGADLHFAFKGCFYLLDSDFFD